MTTSTTKNVRQVWSPCSGALGMRGCRRYRRDGHYRGGARGLPLVSPGGRGPRVFREWRAPPVSDRHDAALLQCGGELGLLSDPARHGGTAAIAAVAAGSESGRRDGVMLTLPNGAGGAVAGVAQRGDMRTRRERPESRRSD